jgi:hypothetical protein
VFDDDYLDSDYFGEEFFALEIGTATAVADAAEPPAPPASQVFYNTPVRHFARVVTKEDGDPVDSWPGSGTLLYANVEQKPPSPRWGMQTEETVTRYDLQFDYAAMVASGVVILRGDLLRISPAYGAEIVLRAIGHATDYNQLGVYVLLPTEQIY